MTKYWITSDYRKIPIKYMTTTHLANAMHHCDTHKVPMFKPNLLEEWYLREKEGICRKGKRFLGRVFGRYYTRKLPKTIYFSGSGGCLQSQLDLTGDM